MRVVAGADFHVDSTMVGRWDAKAGMHSNWIESFARLRDVVDTCNDVQADVLVIAGDTFHTGRPSAESVAMLTDEFKRLNKTTEVIATNGNHDQTAVVGAHRTPIEAFLSDQPWMFATADSTRAVEYEGINFALIPWHRVAGTRALEETSQVLRDDVNRLSDEVAGKPSLLFGHFTVEEAAFSSGRRSSELLMTTSVLEADIPGDMLDEGPWSLWRAGHIHRRQEIGSKQGGYIGSTYKVSFGEADEAKGVDIIDIDDRGNVELSFREFHVRQLISVDISQNASILKGTAEQLKDRDILRLMLAHEQKLTGPQEKTLKDLAKKGVEVQQRHLPKERENIASKSISIDTKPDRAFEIWSRTRLKDNPEQLKSAKAAFADIAEGVANG